MYEEYSLELIYPIEAYDHIWYVHYTPEEGDHSGGANELVEAFAAIVEEIPAGCAECFSFEPIGELKREYHRLNEVLI